MVTISYAVCRDSLTTHQCNRPHSTRWQSHIVLGTYTCHCKGCHKLNHNTQQDMLSNKRKKLLTFNCCAINHFTLKYMPIIKSRKFWWNLIRYESQTWAVIFIEKKLYSLLLQNGSNQPVWQPSAHVPFTCSQVRSFAQCPHRPEQLDP